jgi:lipopolysaccharide transport system permease protein
MDNTNWSIEITPKTNLFKIDVKEVFDYKDLIFLFVKRDFVAVYRQTVLGPLWHLVQPVLNGLIMTVFWIRIARLGINTDVAPIIYFMSAFIVWNHFAGCLNKSSSVFVQNSSIFGKVYFPRVVVPLSYLFSSAIGFAFQFFFLFVVAAFCYLTKGYPLHVNCYIFFAPVSLLMLGLQGMAVGMIVSSFTIKYRDLIYLVSFGVQLLMYLSPVIYTIEFLSPRFRQLMMLNPMAPFIEVFRYSLIGTGLIDYRYFVVSGLMTLLLLFVAIVVFNKTEKSFIDTV